MADESFIESDSDYSFESGDSSDTISSDDEQFEAKRRRTYLIQYAFPGASTSGTSCTMRGPRASLLSPTRRVGQARRARTPPSRSGTSSSRALSSPRASSVPPTQRRAGRPRKRSWQRGRPRQEPAASHPPTRPSTVPPESWRDNVKAIPLQQSSFSEVTGVALNFISSMTTVTPLTVLETLLTPDFFTIIKSQTNKFARQINYKKWKTLTLGELKLFFAIVLKMGLCKKPKIQDYWRTHEIYEETFCPTYLSRDRFRAILSCLHFSDKPASEREHDPLYKLRPIVDLLGERFSQCYNPERNLSLDEGTCPFKGRLRFKTYNPNKPHKWGVKLYQLCESSTGYCLKFKVATSQGATTHGIVMEIMDQYLHKGHAVYTDRYYTSPKLFQDLWENNTLAVGTCMGNRQQLPKEYLRQDIPRGDVIACRKGPLLALKWKDKREVIMLSTIHDDSMEQIDVWDKTTRERIPKMKPSVVQNYNQNMGGVDRSDQLLSYYSFARKSVKWYKRLFNHLLNLSIINAQIVYNAISGNPKMELVRFFESIISDLANEGVQEKRQPSTSRAPTSSTSSRRLTGRHFSSRIPTVREGAIALRVCRVCSDRDAYKTPGPRRNKSKRTVHQCLDCRVALCAEPCFRKYHTKNEYWADSE